MGTPPDQTDAPFAEALTALKQAAGMSYRDLAAQLTEQTGRGLSPSFLSALAKGIERPSPETIADIARVFGKDERYFAEFRLAQLRALLDEGGASGLEGALSIAREIEPALKARVVEVDPRQYPHAMPIGCGPRMRRQRARAAA